MAPSCDTNSPSPAFIRIVKHSPAISISYISTSATSDIECVATLPVRETQSQRRLLLKHSLTRQFDSAAKSDSPRATREQERVPKDIFCSRTRVFGSPSSSVWAGWELM